MTRAGSPASNSATIVQLAYFDESGIDGAHGITLISGFVGNLDNWPKVNTAWRAALDTDAVPQFHYIDCKNQTGPYSGWDWQGRCIPHLGRMSAVITISPIGGVSAGFLGDWNAAVASRPDLRERFPSPYSFCFEMIVEKIRDEMHHHSQFDIVLVFSNQRQYQKRALEIWRWYRDRNAWPEIKDIRYDDPAKVPGLQMADMLAWETRRHLFKGNEGWRSLPLLSRLVPKHEATGTALYERAYRAAGPAGIKRFDARPSKL